MPFQFRTARHGLRVALVAAGSALALQAAAAAPAAPREVPAGADTVLKRLPAGPEELTFRGETAARSFTVQLGRAEAARTTVLQIALLDAVSLLPERSTLRIAINGTPVAALPANAPDKTALLAVRVPRGLLVPGLNTVRITAALAHRVDCSVQATFELWASLDPARTGFLVPRDAAPALRGPADLALEPPAEDGTTRIHLRLGEDPEPDTLAAAAGVVAALVREAHIVRPVVDVGPDAGTGPGFDLVMAPGPDDPAPALTVLGRAAGLTLGRDPVTERLTVAVDGVDPAAFAAAPGDGPAPRGEPAARDGFRRTLANLGLPTDAFAGRHYTASLPVNLPPDFLASNDRARLLLDASHTASLVPGSGLVFRVNGTLVSSLPFAAGTAERFDHAIVELPLRFFHPGRNDLSIEGMTAATADAQCDVPTMSREARLTVAGTSELDFPAYARLATLPQLPAALAYDAAGVDGGVHLYVPDTDRASLGAALTALANLAAGQERMGAPRLHVGLPTALDPPGLVVGGRDDLPERLATVLARITAPVPAPAPESTGADAPPVPAEAPAPALAEDRMHALLAGAQKLLRDRGFFFGADARADTLPVARDGLVVAAVAAHAGSPSVGGVGLPAVIREPAHWLVLAGKDRATTQGALASLVAGGHWDGLRGEAVSFDPGTGALHVLQPRTVSYVLPDRLVMSDIRPILGGVMSDNVALSIGLLFLLMGVLGVSATALIRRVGVR